MCIPTETQFIISASIRKTMRRNRKSMLTDGSDVPHTHLGRLKPRLGFSGADTRTRLQLFLGIATADHRGHCLIIHQRDLWLSI